jgi:hypothetical protein
MRTILLLVVAAAVVGAAAWFLLSPAPAPVPSGGAPVTGGDGGPADAGVIRGVSYNGMAAPAAAPAPPKVAVPRAHAPTGPDVVPPRPLGPPPEGAAGEVPKPDLPPAEQEKLEAVRQKLRDAAFGKIDWRDRSLGAMVKEIAEKSGVSFSIEGEGLSDEPVTARFERQDGLELLRYAAMQRNFRFEVTAERVIVKR